MSLLEIEFPFFFPVAWGSHWLLPRRAGWQNAWLVVASYAFYAGWDWRFCFLLAFSIVWNQVFAQAIHARRVESQRKTLLVVSLVGNLGLLGYFKYADFFMQATIDVIEAILPGTLGTTIAPTIAPLLPIGISFYTFQSLSYTIDVWRERLTPEPNVRRFALFVVFFPQLVALSSSSASRQNWRRGRV